MLPASRVVEFIAEISVTSVEQEVDNASGEGKANSYGLILLEPRAPDGSVSPRRLQCARLFTDEGSLFFYGGGSHSSSPYLSRSKRSPHPSLRWSVENLDYRNHGRWPLSPNSSGPQIYPHAIQPLPALPA